MTTAEPRVSEDPDDRHARVMRAAIELLGSAEQAQDYLETRNFALGGACPIDLLDSPEGEKAVLDELQAHRDSGPL